MLRTLEVKGLRALRYVHEELDAFQVLVGPNASGKSTFFDAILLARDILAVGPERAVFGDERWQVAPRVVAPRDLSWMRGARELQIAITARIPEAIRLRHRDRYRYCRYEFTLGLEPSVALESETLWLCERRRAIPSRSPDDGFPRSSPGKVPDTIVTHAGQRAPAGWRKVVNKIAESGNDSFQSETSKWNNQFRLGPTKSALANLPEDEDKFPTAIWFKRFLMEGVQRLVLDAEAMRMPARPGMGAAYLPDGSNLPWVVSELERTDPARFGEWIGHLRTALPDLANVRTIERPEDRHRYIALDYTTGLDAPSWLVSDGTLRLLALTLLAYANTESRLLLVEEPENGIHPQAVETVFQSLSSVYGRQVFCATQAPVVLSLASLDQLLCFGKARDGAADVVRGDRHPRLRDWQHSASLSDLFAAGVLS